MRRISNKIICVMMGALALLALTSGVIAKPDCTKEDRTLRELAQTVSVALENPVSLTAGGTFHMTWRTTQRFPSKSPVYLVVAIPGEVRFDLPPVPPTPDEMEVGPKDVILAKLPGFLALPPDARGPLGMVNGQGQSRAIVPLYQPGADRSGSFDVRVFAAGDLEVEASVVAVTSCGERVLTKTLERTLAVAPGQPEIVVQDPYDVERPKQAIVSANGRYRANVFEDRYRVYDAETGARIADRAGHELNFSPTSRFIVAAVGDKSSDQYEVIDLVAREVVARPAGSFIGWTYGDAYMIAGKGSWGGLTVRPTLLSRPQPAIAGTTEQTLRADESAAAEDLLDFVHAGSCHACASWTDDNMMLDLDNGILAFSGTFDKNQAQVYELASGAGMCCKAASEINSFVASTYALVPFNMPKGWHAREPIRFTHVYDALADPQAKYLEDQNWFQEAKPLRDQLVLPKVIDPSAAPVRVAGLSGASLVRGDWRSHAERGSGANAEQSVRVRIATELHRLGTNLAPPLAREAIPFSNSWAGADRRVGLGATPEDYNRIDALIEKRTMPLEERLIKEVPTLRNYLGRRKNDAEEYQPPLPYDGLDKGKIDLTQTLEGLWRWECGGRPVWLMQLWATEGNAGIGQGMIILLEADADPSRPKGGSVTDLSTPLEAFWAGANGISEHQTRLKPQVFGNRYLVAASVAQKTILVFDLAEKRQIVLFKGVPQADLIEDVQLSSDGRYVIQFNSDGQFFIHEVEIGRLNILGRVVDDEIIVYTPEGYYWSSYEGAHFVQLRFPGLPGLFPFQQFKAVLDRPDIIRQRLERGGTPLGQPSLSPPPSLSVKRVDRAGAKITTLHVEARASKNLQHLQLFADARLVGDIPLSGQVVVMELPVPDLSNARWLTVQAIDAENFVSVPQSVRMNAGKVTGATLHAVLVGVDRYSNPAFTLRFAESDAKRLGAALQANAGSYYAKTNVTLLLGAEANREAIIASLKRTVAAAAPNDTIVFSFAGHGLQNNDGRYLLTPADFDTARRSETGLAWADIATVLRETKARVVVVLDACHAGLSGSEQAGTNDDAAGALFGATRAPMLVLAASKGRQLSHEHQKWGGGLFTFALVEALSRSRATYDVDSDGAIEVSELYRAVKSIMLTNAGGRQTPWLARQDLIGDFALF